MRHKQSVMRHDSWPNEPCGLHGATRRCMEEVLSLAPSHLPHCRARELSTIAWAAAKAGAWARPAAAGLPVSTLGPSARGSANHGAPGAQTSVGEMRAVAGDGQCAAAAVAAAAARRACTGPEWWALMLGAMQPLLPAFNPQVSGEGGDLKADVGELRWPGCETRVAGGLRLTAGLRWCAQETVSRGCMPVAWQGGGV